MDGYGCTLLVGGERLAPEGMVVMMARGCLKYVQPWRQDQHIHVSGKRLYANCIPLCVGKKT